MTSNYVKCCTCNIVINEVLAFVYNKMTVMDEISLIRICNTAFDSDEILTAKKLLFEALSNKKMKRRRKDGKTNRDLEDIVELLKSTDAEDPEKLPIFVARELHRLPPVTFDHLDATRLLKDILWLQQEVKTIKTDYVSKEDLKDIQCKDLAEGSGVTINNKSAACLSSSFHYDSGPTGMQQDINSGVVHNYMVSGRSVCDENNDNSEITAGLSSSPAKRVLDVTGNAVSLAPIHCVELSLPSSSHSFVCAETAGVCHTSTDVTIMSDNEVTNRASLQNQTKPSMADVLKTSGDSNQMLYGTDNKWQVVSHKKKRTNAKFISNTGTDTTNLNSKFRAAETMLPIYISNVCKQTQESDIIDFIWNKTKEKVTLEKIRVKKEKYYDSYKLCVPRNKLHMFLNDALWPEGICFRRFVVFSEKTKENIKCDNAMNLKINSYGSHE